MEAERLAMAMERGDTFAFSVQVNGLTDGAVTGMYFTVRRAATDEEIVFQKTIGDGITPGPDGWFWVRVAPEDTEQLTAGSYTYDLEIRYGEGDVRTPIKGKFKIAQDVTW